jgi:CBS-domain-containing membrane protein
MTTQHSAARIRAAFLDPAAVFGSPEEVEQDPTLGRQDKLAILEGWEEDARELAAEQDESKAGRGRSRVEEIVAARARLSGGAEDGGEERSPDAGAASGKVRVRRFAKPVHEIVHADHEFDEAALRLSFQEHPVLPVADADQIVGVLARAEFAEAAEEQSRPRDARLTARVMMTTDIAFCYLDDDVATARALMDRHGCDHLLVVDRDRVLVGTLERGDLPPAAPGEESSTPARSDVAEAREDHAQGVASTIQPGGLDVYAERPRIIGD